MIILNFSHPLTEQQKSDIEALADDEIEAVYEIPVQFDNDSPYTEQMVALARAIPLDGHALQTEPLIVNLPSSNFIAAELLAWLHGVMGYFPAILRIKPLTNRVPPIYQAAEIINLQALRDMSRKTR